jgi:hypothetical protein
VCSKSTPADTGFDRDIGANDGSNYLFARQGGRGHYASNDHYKPVTAVKRRGSHRKVALAADVRFGQMPYFRM